MNLAPGKDLLVNVLLPLMLGVVIYWAESHFLIPSAIVNFLPDGLWAYSLMSAILIVWQRRIVAGWVLAACCLSIGFEVLQHYHWIPGTGDLYDVLTYFIFFGLALALNPKYEKQDKTPSFLWHSHHFRSFRRLFKGQ